MTVITGHTPARSHSAVSRATSVLKRRSARMASAMVSAAAAACGKRRGVSAAKRASGDVRERASEARGMALDQAGEIGRGAEDAGQQVGDGGLGDEGRKRGKLGLASAALGELGEHAGGARAIMNDGRGGDAGVEGLIGQLQSQWAFCVGFFLPGSLTYQSASQAISHLLAGHLKWALNVILYRALTPSLHGG